MIDLEFKQVINRSPQEVFDYASNPANNAKWQSGAESAEWTSDEPPGVGSTYKVVTKFLGRRIEAELEVTSWDPPNQWGTKTISGPIPFESKSTIEAQGDGTLITINAQVEFAGFFKMAEPLLRNQLIKQTESDQSAMKMILESS